MAGRIRRPSPAMIVACIALAVALGGVSYAATILPANSVGTLQLKANAVVSSKVLNGSLRRADFKAGQIPAGKQGPAGAAGTAGTAGTAGPAGGTGPAGPKGDSATALWASVDSTGTLVRNKGAASAVKISTGVYQVIFNQDVTGCVYMATLGFANALPNGEIAAARYSGIPAGVGVATFTSAGALFDTGFFLSVFC